MSESLADGLPRLPPAAPPQPRPESLKPMHTQVLPQTRTGAAASGGVSARNEEVATDNIVARVTGPVAVVEQDAPQRRHHTMLPRTMCVAAMLIGLASPLVLILLNRYGHLTLESDRTLTIDDQGRRALLVGVTGAIASYVVGWLWWTAAAAANASHKSKWAMSPWTPLMAFAGATAAVAILPSMAEGQDEGVRVALLSATVLIVVIAHFGILGAFRRSARAVGAPQTYWTRLIVLPWATAAFTAIGSFFATAMDRPVMVVIQVVVLAAFGWYSLSMYQAMLSFDRACIGTVLLGQDDQAFAKFLKHRT